jgi:hypothetical protein
MAVNKVEIYVSQILEDLDNGLTWLKKDDLGYGSIQDKYNAKDQQIAMIRKHPALKDAETTVTVFTVIDDTKQKVVSEPVVEVVVSAANQSNYTESAYLEDTVAEVAIANEAEEELSAFANL